MNEAQTIHEVVESLCGNYPRRVAGSDSERAAHTMLAERAKGLGAQVEVRHFRFNRSLYAVMAAHFALVVVAVLIAPEHPWPAALLTGFAAASYRADSTRSGYWLRRVFPWRKSQNVLATLPSRGERRLRVVVPAHVDAAYTGLVFSPALLRFAGGGRSGERQPWSARAMRQAVDASVVLALVIAARAVFGFDSGWWRALELILAIPALLVTVFNLEVVLRNRIVPGAADNATGVAGALVLLERLSARRPDGLELVVAFTGAEEAGTGGAWALSRQMRDEWSTDETVIVALDTLSNGQLRWLIDGEMAPIELDPAIEAALVEVAASELRFNTVRRFEAPVGASDVMPFLAVGYSGVCITRTDLEYGAPRHYHHPDDVPENVSVPEVIDAVDFAEALILRLCNPAAESAPS